MRLNQRILLRYRAVFGAGFVLLGAITVWRVIVAAAPPNSKILGGLLGVVMVGLGIARIMQYVRGRDGAGS